MEFKSRRHEIEGMLIVALAIVVSVFALLSSWSPAWMILEPSFQNKFKIAALIGVVVLLVLGGIRWPQLLTRESREKSEQKRMAVFRLRLIVSVFISAVLLLLVGWMFVMFLWKGHNF